MLGGDFYQIVELLLLVYWLEGVEGCLLFIYVNFYIGNGFVVVLQYGDFNDKQVFDVLWFLFLGCEVIGVLSCKIIEGGGFFYCLMQQ